MKDFIVDSCVHVSLMDTTDELNSVTEELFDILIKNDYTIWLPMHSFLK